MKNFTGFALIALALFWATHLSALIQKSLKTFQQVKEQGLSYVQAIVLLNMLLPIVCLAGILTGAVLILRGGKWGYYIALIFAAGYVAEQFFFG